MSQDVVKAAKKNHNVFSMIPSELYSDHEVTHVCLAILGYALVNINRAVGRTEIMGRFKIGKQTYYDAINILEQKGYCVKVDGVNYEKGKFGFTSVGHIFYKYPINSLKWMEEYGTAKDNEIAKKILFWQLDNTDLTDEQVGLIKDTIAGSMKDTCGSNEGHYSGSNEGHIINSIDKTNRIEKNIKKDFSHDCDSIAHSDTVACTNNKHQNEANDCVLLSPQAPNSGDVRKAPCKVNMRSDARIAISPERQDELKQMFEAFRVEYRKANGSVMGLDKEFDNLKKRHPKTWQDIVPILLEKLKDQNAQRKAQKEEQNFTPELPMLSRYIKEGMWDRHYYTSTKAPEQSKTIIQFTEDQLKPLHG